MYMQGLLMDEVIHEKCETEYNRFKNWMEEHLLESIANTMANTMNSYVPSAYFSQKPCHVPIAA